MSMYPRKTNKIIPKKVDNDSIFKSKAEIIAEADGKELVIRKEDTKEITDRTPSIVEKLWLNDIKNTRRTISKLIRSYYSGGIDIDKCKNTLYMIQLYLQALKQEADMTDHDTLAEIAKVLKKEGKL